MPDRIYNIRPTQRWRAFVEGIPQLVWCAAEPGIWSWSSRQWQTYTGQTFDASLGWGWLEAVHPEDRQIARRAWQDAVGSGAMRCEYRLRDAEAGRYRWHKTEAFPVRDDDGSVIEWLGTSTNVDELRQARQRLMIVNGQLEHRIRNGLAIVRSIVRRTSSEARDVDELATLIMGRIDALARAQTQARGNGGVALDRMIAEELRVHGVDDRRVAANGPDVQLRDRFAESLAVILNELIGNSVLNGALGPGDVAARGGLRLTWSLDNDGGPQFALYWEEDYRSARRGSLNVGEFGFDMICQTLPYEFDADASVTFSATKLRVVAIVPADQALYEHMG